MERLLVNLLRLNGYFMLHLFPENWMRFQVIIIIRQGIK